MSKQVILTIPDSVDLSTLREMKLILRYYRDGNDLYEYSTDSFSLSEAKGDLISRESLKKKIEEIVETEMPIDEKWALGLRYALKLIDNTPAVEPYISPEVLNQFAKYVAEHERPKGEWIPVSERLPEKEDFYLVFLENEQMVVAHSSGIIANHDFEPKMLAWQPLPEPYKKGGAENDK
jgi:hypothetical protein